MNETTALASGSGWGTVTIAHDGPPPEICKPRSPRSWSRYVWRPCGEIASDLPTDFRLELDCFEWEDGIRRFVPVDEIDAFILRSALAGLAILAVDKELSSEQTFS